MHIPPPTQTKIPWRVYVTERTTGLVLHELSLISGGGKITFGARSMLVESLLERWLEERRLQRLTHLASGIETASGTEVLSTEEGVQP